MAVLAAEVDLDAHWTITAIAAVPESCAGGGTSTGVEGWSTWLGDRDAISIHWCKGGSTIGDVVVKAQGWNAVIESTADGVYVHGVAWLVVGLILGGLREVHVGVGVAGHS